MGFVPLGGRKTLGDSVAFGGPVLDPESPFRNTSIGPHLSSPSPKSHRLNKLYDSISAASTPAASPEVPVPTYTALRKQVHGMLAERAEAAAAAERAMDDAKRVEAEARKAQGDAEARVREVQDEAKKLEAVHEDTARLWLESGCSCKGKLGEGSYRAGVLSASKRGGVMRLRWAAMGSCLMCATSLDVAGLKVSIVDGGRVCALSASDGTSLRCQLDTPEDTRALADSVSRLLK